MRALEPSAYVDHEAPRRAARLRVVTEPLPELAYHGWRRHVKRAIDVTAIVVTLPITVPVMLITAAAIKLTSRGPVIFRQERIGFHGEPFRLLKFRTMCVDATDRLQTDPDLLRRYVGSDYKLSAAEDPRIARLGRFLRRSSLDELPQILNVLAGSMSLVGPRPIMEDELACYGSLEYAYLDVKPGITGRWQTVGRNNVRYPERAALDADYLATWRLGSDMKILLRTIPRVICRNGSH